MSPERFHLTLATGDRPTMHGWWGREETARGKFDSWVGTWGTPGARVSLVDEENGSLLTAWPDES
ncbi:hypothetical protein [Streptomyces cylindrosporus]|uniref:Uncharacterized protein n=1 Tax=Streptomyces cylindrosporus TaxID=2927583 RepID=A0ABS9YJW4_9ACTN|nr:hypothetical protein [Streptomyces cylindrosporus]MCI3277547.1 hypothetical protein [Streptomyces cylindrosporus]